MDSHLDSKIQTPTHTTELTIEDMIKDVCIRLAKEHRANKDRDSKVVMGLVMMLMDRGNIPLTWEERREFL